MGRYPFWNGKKVRGWKRQKRMLQALKSSYEVIDWQRLDENHCLYMELWLAPWSNFVKRNPPIWFRRLFLSYLFELHTKWKEQIEKKYEDYYLKIWVFHPHFYNSQIVLAVKDKIDFYKNRFIPCDNMNITIPKEYEITEINKFKWVPFFEQELSYKSDFELESDEIEWWEKNADSKKEIDEDTEYRKNIGYFWLNEV